MYIRTTGSIARVLGLRRESLSVDTASRWPRNSARYLFWLLPPFLSACALPGVVQRTSVEYNEAAASMANQVTLLNILRAKEDLPEFYTSFTRLSGSTQVTMGGGFNAQVKASSPVETTSTQTMTPNTNATTVTNMSGLSGSSTTPSTPGNLTSTVMGTSSALTNAVTTTTGPTLTTLASRALTSGGNLYAPSVTGQVVSGPSFDINILDTQVFYAGILADVPFATVEIFQRQDYDEELLLRLLVERIEYRLQKPVAHFNKPAGTPIITLRNVISRTAGGPQDKEAREFADAAACLSLTGADADPTPLAPLSRVTQFKDKDGKPIGLSIQDLAAFDGQKLDLRGAITRDPADDAQVQVVRPSTSKRVPTAQPGKPCNYALVVPPKEPEKAASVPEIRSKPTAQILGIPETPPAERVLISHGRAIVLADDERSDVVVPTDIYVTFRSPEGVIRFLGQYLKAAEDNSTNTYQVGVSPLFSVCDRHCGTTVASAEVLGHRYYIADDRNRPRNMQVIGLIEELVNLQKSSADHPVTTAVHVIQ
jgi:hypothetical protein